jgi:cystathionine beta-lyase/cystathionine gamma-synthase
MTQSRHEHGISTRCVHAGELEDPHGSPHTPVYTTTTHHGLSEEERARRGITGSMVRLSVGLEDAEDLIANLEQALG